jgi:Carboxypeptidase regulatory-like domain
VPVVDPSAKPPSLDGTVSGHLATIGGERVAGRKIQLVEINTGSRHSVTTDANGAFTVKVPPGKYRLDVELLSGERVEKAPKQIDINESDLDSNLEIVIGR